MTKNKEWEDEEMTLDEAIAHCLEVAEKKDDEINNKPHLFDSQQEMDDCANCAADHRQLAEWLKELKRLRKGRKRGHWILTQDEDYEYCTCSECGYQNGENWMIGSDIPYCAECGSYNGGDRE